MTRNSGQYQLRTAQGISELESVYRFRYEHFFKCFAAGYSGLDHARRLVYEPHDFSSMHYCASDAEGNIYAVSTATPADADDAPAAWLKWFQLEKFRHAGSDKVVVSTHLVLHPDYRGCGLFEVFYRFIIESYVKAGFQCAVHYCSPDLVPLYEKLSHRSFGEPFTIAPGLMRTPMLIFLEDPGRFQRIDSLMASLNISPLLTPPMATAAASLQEVKPCGMPS